METKSLAVGIVGFLLGGLVVSVAATLEEAGDEESHAAPSMTAMTAMSEEMTRDLADRQGDAYDAAFIEAMIEHHRGAVDMARLSAERAEHPQITRLSAAIVDAQRTEIAQMRQWQDRWGYRD